MKSQFNTPQVIYITSWTSVLILLWGMITELIESSFVSWFAFVFFIVTPILVYASNYRK